MAGVIEEAFSAATPAAICDVQLPANREGENEQDIVDLPHPVESEDLFGEEGVETEEAEDVLTNEDASEASNVGQDMLCYATCTKCGNMHIVDEAEFETFNNSEVRSLCNFVGAKCALLRRGRGRGR